jgi:hypothetical protein
LTTTQFSIGLWLNDNLPKPWIQAALWNNSVAPQDSLSEGISINNTTGTVTSNNTITGSGGFDAIGLYSSTLGAVIRNDVSGFTVDTTVGPAQILLDPSTTRDLVVCGEPSDSIVNQGTNNIVIGCQQLVATPELADMRAVPAASRPRPSLPRGKPWLH